MEISERDKWLYIYTLTCTKGRFELIEKLPNIKKIKNFLNGDCSKERIRDYFFIVHNPKTFEFMERAGNYEKQEKTHLIIPYRVEGALGNSLSCKISWPFYELPGVPSTAVFKGALEQAIEFEVIEEIPSQGDILLVHGNYIVDVVKEKDLKKYDYLYKRDKRKQR